MNMDAVVIYIKMWSELQDLLSSCEVNLVSWYLQIYQFMKDKRSRLVDVFGA